MTREEIIELLKVACAAFDSQRLDAISESKQAGQELDNLRQEIKLAKDKVSEMKRSIAARESALAEKDKEIEKLKAQLE